MLERPNLKPSLRKPIAILSAILSFGFVVFMASPALAGGFQLALETPKQAGNPQSSDAVLIARTFGCHQPADAKLIASAEGIVNGRRQSIPVELRSIGSGVYAVRQQWPSEGTWVLALSGAYNGMTCSVLVELGPNGKVLPGTRLEEGSLTGVHAKAARRKWLAAEIDAALNAPAGVRSESAEDVEQLMLSPLSAITWALGGLGASVLAIGYIRKSGRNRSHV